MASGTPGTWIFNAENEINLIGTTVGGDAPDATTADIIAFLPGVSDGICSRVNAELGITGAIAETGINFTSASHMISTGAGTSILATASNGTIGDDVAALDAQPFGCFTQGGDNVYYHVLIER